jgi:hypothetical protein
VHSPLLGPSSSIILAPLRVIAYLAMANTYLDQQSRAINELKRITEDLLATAHITLHQGALILP